MSKLLVLGANGMLGHKICQLMPNRGHQVFATIRRDAASLRGFKEIFDRTTIIEGVDAMDDASLQRTIDDLGPDVIVNCIGIVKQLPQADNALLSVAINSYLPHKLAHLSAERGCRLVHISTDCVFSGSRGHYRRTDPSDAQDFYGKSKFLGETDTTERSAVTLRTSFIGREIHRPTHGLLEWLLSQKGKTVKGFTGAVYTGFTSNELGNVIGMLIEKHPQLCGVYQVAGEPINKYDLLVLVRDVYGLNVTIQRDEAFQCDRSMEGTEFHQATGYIPPSWHQMIRQIHEDPTPYDAWFVEQ